MNAGAGRRWAVGMALGVLMGCGTAWGTAPIHLDIEADGSATAGGYVHVTAGYRWDNGSPLSLGGGVQIGWTAYVTGGSRDRSSYADLLLRDFIQWSTGASSTLKITGLDAGSYTLTVYSVDLQW